MSERRPVASPRPTIAQHVERVDEDEVRLRHRPATRSGALLGIALLADRSQPEPASTGAVRRVTAQLGIQWLAAWPAATPARARLTSRIEHGSFVTSDIELIGDDDTCIARARSLFAAAGPLTPSVDASRATVSADRTTVTAPAGGSASPIADEPAVWPLDVLGASIDAQVAGSQDDREVRIELADAYRNRSGVLHGAVGYALVATVAERVVGPTGAVGRILDGSARFLRPTHGATVGVTATVVARSQRLVDVLAVLRDGERDAVTARFVFEAVAPG